MSDEKKQKNIEKIKKRYINYINKNFNLNKISNSVDVFTIRSGVLPDTSDPYILNDILENGLQGNEDYQFLGVIVTTKKL